MNKPSRTVESEARRDLLRLAACMGSTTTWAHYESLNRRASELYVRRMRELSKDSA